jgi:hypothetical protein
MFMALEEVTNALCAKVGIDCMRVRADSKVPFVLSDHPVAHYDPTPKTPESRAGFMSSPNSLTWVPLDPNFGVMLSARHPQAWREIEASDDYVDELNLLTYAWAREAIYGPSQEAVTHVRRAAKQNQTLLGEFRYRPPRIWVSQGGDDRCGVHEFTSRYKGQTVKRKLYVTEEGMAEARRSAEKSPQVPAGE